MLKHLSSCYSQKTEVATDASSVAAASLASAATVRGSSSDSRPFVSCSDYSNSEAFDVEFVTAHFRS